MSNQRVTREQLQRPSIAIALYMIHVILLLATLGPLVIVSKMSSPHIILFVGANWLAIVGWFIIDAIYDVLHRVMRGPQ